MNRCALRRLVGIVVSILAILLFLSAFAGAQRTDRTSKEAPTLIADKISYLPGETIVFSGGSWTPREGVTIVVKTGSAGIVATIQASADENGILNISAPLLLRSSQNILWTARASLSRVSPLSSGSPTIARKSFASNVQLQGKRLCRQT